MNQLRKSHGLVGNYCCRCGGKLDEEWNFCPHCNTKIEKIYCPSCKKTVNADWNFCPYCKKNLKKQNNNKDIDKANEWLREVLYIKK